MAIRITDDCINCGACEPECPNNAIYEGGIQWRYRDGTNLTTPVSLPNGVVIDPDAPHAPSPQNTTISCPVNVQNARAFTRSRNAPLSALWIAAYPTLTMWRRQRSF